MQKLLVFLILWSVALVAQPVSTIGAEHGLAHPTVYATVQDPYGFVWFATREGLYRYIDGRAERVEFSANEQGKDNVQSLLVCGDSSLWVGLQGGLEVWDITTGRPVLDHGSPVEGMTISALFEDDRGSRWVGTQGNGLWERTAGGQWRHWEARGTEPLEFIFDFAQQDHKIWIGASGSSFWYVDLENGELVQQEDSRASSFRKTVDVFGDQVAFGVEDQGVFVLDATKDIWEVLSGPFGHGEPVISPRDLSWVDSGELWVSTDGEGIFVYEDSSWSRFSKEDEYLGISTNQFYTIERIGDSHWIGSFNDGVAVFPVVGESIEKLRKPDEFSYTSIQSALTLASVEDELWVGFDGDGLLRYTVDGEGRNWWPEIIKGPGIPRVITSMARDQDGSMWIGSFNEGISHVRSDGTLIRNYLAFTTYSSGLGNNNIWSLERGEGDSLWVGTLGGLFIWDGTEFTMPWENPWDVGRSIMALDYDGTHLWVGSEFQGLYSVSKDLAVRNYALEYTVLDVAHLDGHEFVATEGGGLYVLQDDSLRLVNVGAKTVYALEVHKGELVMSTSEGLQKLRIENDNYLIDFLASADRLQGGLFNRKALLSNGDELLIGSTDGVSKVVLEGIEKDRVAALIVDGFYADNKRMEGVTVVVSGQELAEPLRLPAGTRSVQADFFRNSLFPSAGTFVEYRIEGLSELWTALNPTTRSVNFGNLRPGQYVLELRTVDGEQREYSSLRVPIIQQAYVWQQSWFKALVGLLSIIIVGGGVALYQDRKLRATRVQLLETERELLAAKAGEMEAKAKQKSDELGFQLLKTSSRVEVLLGFKERLEQETKVGVKSDETKSLLRSLIRELGRELQSENYWDHFERNYRDLHLAFSEGLVEKHPDLTKGEIRLSYLIRQKMSNKEISTVLNNSPAAVEKAKYRLKKKLALGKDDDLVDYISNL
ncbi:MAG: hypothetical protein RL754_403 [Bacteroidota bacterium]|jgi:ligand-binding sensor domain-containing protein/DNA-binding CsgD family transcriptional regulator